jgi:hypothetical protein
MQPKTVTLRARNAMLTFQTNSRAPAPANDGTSGNPYIPISTVIYVERGDNYYRHDGTNVLLRVKYDGISLDMEVTNTAGYGLTGFERAVL